MNKFIDNKLVIGFCLLTVVLLWGANFVSIKLLLVDFTVFTALFYRMLLVAVILLPWVSKPSKNELGILLLTSLMLVPGHFGFLFLSLLNTTSVASMSVVIQVSIPFSVLLAWFFYKENPGKIRLLGLAISFAGVVVLFYDPAMFDNLLALVLITISALCLGSYYVLVKKVTSLSPIGVIAYTSLIGSPFLLVFALLQGEDLGAFLQVTSALSWAAFSFTVIGGSLIGHSVWAWLAKHQDISLISPFLLLVPVIASALSALVFEEVMSLMFVISSSIILFGLLLVMTGKKLGEKLSLLRSVK